MSTFVMKVDIFSFIRQLTDLKVLILMKTGYVTIGLTNPKSPTNVGAVMRAAGCYQVDGVFYTGERYARAARFNTDTKGVSESIPLTGVNSLLESIEDGTKVICVDLIEGAIPLPQFSHPDKAFYIFGPEDGTISQHVIDHADAVVYVPTVGCMNLAASVNVLLYDRLAKADDIVASDELIRLSRDTNNKVKVKGQL
jgi:tRNA(Leu) C34 or U34 (ribose-2'-O)-methylase TrmL|tara:strand:+ start:226 stop:816 length:591 start_codon:yes stop_codon:yes gene_type:complete